MYRLAVGIRSYGNRFRKIELPTATESRKNVFVCGEMLKVLLKNDSAQQITSFENDFGFEIKKVINGKLDRKGSLRIRIHYLDNYHTKL